MRSTNNKDEKHHRMHDGDKDRQRGALKVGLIVDFKLGSKYIHELARWGQGRSDVVISHLIIQNIEHVQIGFIARLYKSIKKNGFLHLVKVAGFALITKLESYILSKTAYKDHGKKFDLGSVVPEALDVDPIVSKSGFVYRYNDRDIQRIKNLELDILIRCGSGILRGNILDCTKFGVVSFHHADHNINRGGPAGFWEVYYKQDQTGFIIQRLTEELDGGIVLLKGRIATKFLYLMNQASIYTRSNVFMQKLLSNVALTGTLPAQEGFQPYYNPLYKIPTFRHQIKYLINSGVLIIRKLYARLLKKHYQWGVAYVKSDWKNLVMHRGIKITPPQNHFLADPFVITKNNEDYCFLEDYNFADSKGTIAVYKLGAGRAERLGEVLNEPFHLSFPYIFQFDSKLFMCPETSENNDIRLYEAVNFPMEWKLSKIVMSDISAADSMIFEHGGKWWLFTNIDSAEMNDHCSELHIFYADSPLSQDWKPHAHNPVIIDSACARNAGILYSGSDIYRVSQTQGFDMYGKGFSINRITSLGADQFTEHRVSSVESNFFDKIDGTHHLHSNGKISAFDYAEFTSINA